MPKRAPLVSQHIENISRDALENYQNVIRSYVRHRQGVYALYHRTKLYYVGLAKDLRWRLKAHLNDHHGESWDRFSIYFTIGDQHMKELESLILRIVKPKGNKVKGKFASSQDLRRQLARDIRSENKRELALLLGREWIDPRPTKSKRDFSARATLLASYFASPTQLRAKRKGKLFRAHVRSDGQIRFGGKLYRSPSAAAAVAVGHACNGWYFWKFERAPGDWIRLGELRQ
ncbi:MAG: hypothetical protein LAO03_12425 [Acidobacteriia bacterium]|nr:hypothetical protein [Terriglobia bacterium]